MRFFFLTVAVIFTAFLCVAPARASSDYAHLQKQISDLSRLIRLSEDRLSVLDESLAALERQQKKLMQDIAHNRYHSTVSLHHMLSRTFYPPVFAFLDKNKSVHAQYYEYRTIRALHDHYQYILNDQIARKTELDTQAEQIRQYQHDRDMMILSLNANIEQLKRLRQSHTAPSPQEIADFQAQINEIRQRHHDLNDFITSITGTTFENTPDMATVKTDQGFVLPVSGTIAVQFGERTIIGGRADGISIKARANAPVLSPLSGHVLYAGQFNRLGNVLIIQHRDNLLSIFKGLANIYAQTGDVIEQNQVIGNLPQENQQESHNGAMLYYELRYNDTPVNPLDKLSG